MQPQLHRLPQRFPVGTRYVVEGRSGIAALESEAVTSSSRMAGTWICRRRTAMRPGPGHSGAGEKNKFASSGNGKRRSEFSA